MDSRLKANSEISFFYTVPEVFSRRARRLKTGSRRTEAGYALLIVVFLAAVMLVAAAAVAPNLLTQGRRENEEEMIWRGEQYVRAIRLYYRKNGRFPRTMEDLTEKRGTIRFLRKAYRDPMNRKDGSWRMIYVGPGGQLIGSVTRPGGLQFPAAQPIPAAAGTQPATGGPGPAASVPPRGTNPPQPAAEGQPAPLPSSTTPGEGQVYGGNIIGVASKVEKPSIKLYNGRQIYRQWEFIWDPAKEAGLAVVPGQPASTPAVQPPAPTPRP
jgi:type II secretory pathway pseudopilin PulG